MNNPSVDEMEKTLMMYGIIATDYEGTQHTDIMYDSLRSVMLRMVYDVEELKYENK